MKERSVSVEDAAGQADVLQPANLEVLVEQVDQQGRSLCSGPNVDKRAAPAWARWRHVQI